MIVNIRGTSGAGKSYIVFRLMEKYERREPHFVTGRKQPQSYTCYRETGNPLFVCGHYEIPTGGADTLKDYDFIYGLIREAAARGEDVIWEGLVMTSEVTRAIYLAKDYPLLVIGLTTSLEECLASVQSRRDTKAALKGEASKPLDPSNTEAKWKMVKNQASRFRDANVDFRWLNRAEALKATLEAFGWPT